MLNLPPPMRWFGAPRGVPMEADCEHAATPVGFSCVCGCGHTIVEGDQGLLIWHLTPRQNPLAGEMPWLIECFLRQIGVPTTTPPLPCDGYHLVVGAGAVSLLSDPGSSLRDDDPALD